MRDLPDPRAHGTRFLQELHQSVIDAARQGSGSDDRPLVTFEFADEGSAEEFATLGHFEVVSHENRRVILAFASTEALETFEARLSSLARGEQITRQALVYAIDAIHAWTAEDRTGRALSLEGPPAVDEFAVDVEIWPLERPVTRTRVLADFEEALVEHSARTLDKVSTNAAIIYRIAVDRATLGWLLNHRDVRRVDLPPRWIVTRGEMLSAMHPLPELKRANEALPGVAVLDSGVVEGHPLIAAALGDAQSFYSAESLTATDDHGHGTFVAALAAYGDLTARLASGLSCEVVLFSGRVLDTRAEYYAGIGIDLKYDCTIIANDVRAAVDYFRSNYQCRVYCLSFGDARKPYRGGHLSGLAVALDQMARELDVLFVVSAGNVMRDAVPLDARESYPSYLFDLDNRILDPGTAINAMTVGSIARRERDDYQVRNADDPRHLPIARLDEPSPFSRTGPTVAGITKPDVVHYGGNYAIAQGGAPRVVTSGLGEISARHDYTGGALLGEICGTSAAAPVVAFNASRVLGSLTSRSPMLTRAILVSHARVPRPSRVLVRDADQLSNLVGLGLIDETALFSSSERVVTLIAEDSISNGTHHFYEVPVPEEFFKGPRRRRYITIAVSHFPAVRTSRIEYKEARLSFKLVPGDLQRVAQMFNAATDENSYENIPELGAAHSIGSRKRSRGSLQCCTWSYTAERDDAPQLILVLTRNDRSWSASRENPERYAVSIVIDDRANAEARLYAFAQQQLRARARLQTRGS